MNLSLDGPVPIETASRVTRSANYDVTALWSSNRPKLNEIKILGQQIGADIFIGMEIRFGDWMKRICERISAVTPGRVPVAIGLNSFRYGRQRWDAGWRVDSVEAFHKMKFTLNATLIWFSKREESVKCFKSHAVGARRQWTGRFIKVPPRATFELNASIQFKLTFQLFFQGSSAWFELEIWTKSNKETIENRLDLIE